MRQLGTEAFDFLGFRRLIAGNRWSPAGGAVYWLTDLGLKVQKQRFYARAYNATEETIARITEETIAHG